MFVGLAVAFYSQSSSQFVMFLCKVGKAGIFSLISQGRKLSLQS